MVAAALLLSAGGGTFTATAQTLPAPRYHNAKQDYLTKTKQIRKKTYLPPKHARRRAAPQYANRQASAQVVYRRPTYEIIARKRRYISPRFYNRSPSVITNVPPLRTVQPKFWK
jgi:hypothetical protein